MNKNAAKLAELRNEFINTIESIAKSKLTLDNMIVFDNPVYMADDTYYSDDNVDAMALGDNGEQITMWSEDEEVGSLVGLTTESLAEIADILENGAYSIDE